MIVYSIVNHKGGVGKTTTAAALASALASDGKRILLLDLDPQASLTATFAQSPGVVSMEDVITEPRRISDSILTCMPGIDIVPATATLAVILQQIPISFRSALILKTALQNVALNYDYAIIDSPSSLGLAMINALTAAEVVLAPIQCDFLSLRGLIDIQEMVEELSQSSEFDRRLRVLAVMCDKRISYTKLILDELRAAQKERLYSTVIPRNILIAEAPALGQSIMEYAPNSPGAKAYRALAREIQQEDKEYGKKNKHSSSDTNTVVSRNAA